MAFTQRLKGAKARREKESWNLEIKKTGNEFLAALRLCGLALRSMGSEIMRNELCRIS